jgi:formylglycine-generating enzyme required for sulfatase activity
MKKCPYCSEEIQNYAVKCTCCGELLKNKQFSNAQPVWHFVLLSILTGGLYCFYWIYRNWIHLKAHKGLNISPFWRTVGLSVPIYGLILIYRQLEDIRNFSKTAGVDETYSPGWILFGFLILPALGGLPDPFWLLGFTSLLPLAVVQRVLNLYWKKEQPELVERTKFSKSQIVLLVIGGICWLPIIIGMFLPEFAEQSPKETNVLEKYIEQPGTETFTNSIGMKFVHIPPGTFMMGSPLDDPGRRNDESQHLVTLSKGFYMQTTEVTQGQWESIMGARPWSGKEYVCDNIDCPAIYISWNDCQDFIRRLNQKEATDKYRLPTEAEWEYACRAGSTTTLANGGITKLICGYDPNLDAIGWYCGNSDDKTHPVAQKDPNDWGLYDMHGNVFEWCQDYGYGDYASGHVIDPKGPSSGYFRVLRGGDSFDAARWSRSASRYSDDPGHRHFSLGFRVARDL